MRSSVPSAAYRKDEQAAPSTVGARSLLMTVLGELVSPTGKPVWTSSLLCVMKGLGIEEQTIRQVIARGRRLAGSALNVAAVPFAGP